MGLMKSYIGREHMLLPEIVCHKCFNNDELKDLIKSDGETKGCSFCNSKAKSHRLSDVIQFISNSLHSEYENPVENMSYETREGGYHGASTYDTYEILEMVDLDVNSQDLFDTIASNIPNDHWCETDPYQLRDHQESIYDWERFSRLVKYKCRYMFLKHETAPKDFFDDQELVSSILNKLIYIFENQNLIKTINTNTKIYRSRHYNTKNPFELRLREIAPPKDGKPSSSRMSPAGIPMFYGAKEEGTALKEIKATKGNNVVTAIFKTKRKLRVVDLTSIPYIPSIFSGATERDREEIRFLNAFLKDFSKPIKKDGQEHVEYVPTQIITEFCKYNMKSGNTKIDGFKYPSSVDNGKVAYCLFVDRYQCGVKKSNSFGFDNKDDQILSLLKNSIKLTKVK
jgi:hypothetical protein